MNQMNIGDAPHVQIGEQTVIGLKLRTKSKIQNPMTNLVEAIKIISESRSVLSQFNILLHKVASNSREVMDEIPQSDQIQISEVGIGSSPICSTQGVLPSILALPCKPHGCVHTLSSFHFCQIGRGRSKCKRYCTLQGFFLSTITIQII